MDTQDLSLAGSELRAAAEAQLVRTKSQLASVEGSADLLYELEVHQVELEMQNESLRQALEAQEVLEASRDRYVALYELAPVGYLTLSRSAVITDINVTGALFLGEARETLLMLRFAPFVADDDRERWHHFLLRVWHQPRRRSCDVALLRSDGSFLSVQADCQPAPNDDVYVTLTDITERKHAEEEMRIAAIAFESQDGMMVTNQDSIIVRVNKAFTHLTGFSAEEAIGQTPALLSSGRHDKAFYHRMWAMLLEDGYWQGEMWNRRKKGKVYAEWLTISAVATPDGVPSHYVGTFSEITKNQEAQAEIHRLAYYDPLTHLPNRRLLHDRIGQAMVNSSRNGHHGALLFLDLDNFKTLNDTQGHDVGDQLLMATARQIQENVRAGDTVARLGGDEFVVMLEDLGVEQHEAAIQADQVGEKIRAAMSTPHELSGRLFHGSGSIGIALFRGQEKSVEILLKHADLAMYQAKNAGRNALRFFDPAMQTALEERAALESDLRLALKRDEFQLYYQAQVDGARRVFGAEALLRWRHPVRGLVAPNDFIPLAEETGLILPIGLWVLKTACCLISAWSKDAATSGLQLAVNVSARQFRQPEFVTQVTQVLKETGADPTRLKLELTESVVIEEVEATIARMQTLKALGISFSMDDFGTGFSSLAYLQRLPLDQLKVDRSFIQHMASNDNDATIVQTIITMGKTLGLHVIAEGVETEVQLARLNEYGCFAYQGYLFSRPLPLEEFERFSGLHGKSGISHAN